MVTIDDLSARLNSVLQSTREQRGEIKQEIKQVVVKLEAGIRQAAEVLASFSWMAAEAEAKLREISDMRMSRDYARGLEALNLRRLMSVKNIDFQELQRVTRLDERTLRGIANGDAKAQARTIHQLARGLRVEVDELYLTPTDLAAGLAELANAS